jgi:3-oxoacyl-[acyl-carrier protein] reductase
VDVTLVARNPEALASAAAAIHARTGRMPRIVAADLATESGRERVLAACPAPDILVTNAGGPPPSDFRAISRAMWSDALETNLLSAVHLIQATVDAMAARQFGRIVNITSMTVRTPVQRFELSSAPRLALTGYVAGVAREVARFNVTINNLLPGTILTERLQGIGKDGEQLVARVPAGRAGRPEEFAAACAFFCSAQAGYITGQSLLVDGGICPITI